jgi:NodT family efflux transporter outer membrane factor (OMF) lipoprotein
MGRMNQFMRPSKTGTGKRALAIAIACGALLLVLPSCGIPPLRNPAPGPGVPGSFNGAASPDNSAQVRIEDFFRDPLLTSLIEQALVGNQELRILGETVQIASNEIMARQGAYLPFIYPAGQAGMNRYSRYSLGGAGIRDDPYLPGKFLPNPLPVFGLGFSFLWTPDIWWQLHNAKDAAAVRYYAAAEGRNYFVTTLVAEIADNYYQLIALDKRLEILDQTIALQEKSLEVARAKKEAARGTELDVQRFLAEVRRNQSEKLIVHQDIIQVENRINFLAGRNPQHVERVGGDFIDLNLPPLGIGVPAQLLLNRPDIRQAERELTAAGLDVLVARKRFYPQGFITAGVGYEAFNPRYLFLTPEALIGNAIGNLLVPLINRKAIKADYLSANAQQLQAVYNYQRVVLTAFTEMINRLAKVENYRKSIELKKQQMASLEASVELASRLYQFARADYVDVLFAQRDLRDARTVTVETKQQELSAIVNAYQALGGGAYLLPIPVPQPLIPRHNWFSRHSHEYQAAVRGPAPLPPPVAAEGIPEPFPTPPPGTGPALPLPPPAAISSGPPPVPGTDAAPAPVPDVLPIPGTDAVPVPPPPPPPPPGAGSDSGSPFKDGTP